MGSNSSSDVSRSGVTSSTTSTSFFLRPRGFLAAASPLAFSSGAPLAFFVLLRGAVFFAGAFFAADFFAAGFLAAGDLSSAPEAAPLFADAALATRVVFFAGAFTSGVSSLVAESFAEARDALTRVPFVDGYAQQSRLQIGIPHPF